MPAGLDFLLHVAGDEKTKVATVNVEKQKDAPAEKNIILQGRVVGKSLAFARVAEKPSNADDQLAQRHCQLLAEIIEAHEGRPLTTTQLLKELAPKVIEEFDTLGTKAQGKETEKLRLRLRRLLLDPNPTSLEAVDFQDHYRDGYGQKTKWRHKDAMSS